MTWPRARPAVPRQEIVTGERLQALADVTLVSKRVRDFHRTLDRHIDQLVVFDEETGVGDDAASLLGRHRSIFVYTHDLEMFVSDVWPRLGGSGYVLITHNSDEVVDERYSSWLSRTGDKLTRWFAQNAELRDPKIVPLPIGIANSMWPHGSLREAERAMRRQEGRARDKQLFVRFSVETHPARAAARQALATAFPDAAAEAPHEGYRSYLAELGRHRFAAAPRGNGVDTHRIWESLYLGVVPIVERSPHTEHWLREGLPLLLIDDWRTVSRELLETEGAALSSETTTHDPLRLSYYRRLVAEATRSSAGGGDSVGRS